MRIRQLVLVAADLDGTVAQIRDIFGLAAGFNDPGVEYFGLRNEVLTIGDTFLEVVSPIRDDTAAGRYRARRGGDCGYMVMIQSDDYRSDRERVESLGVRIVWSAELDDISGIHLHPRDTGGPLLSLDQPIPPDSWRWAGPNWHRLSETGNARAVLAAEIADPDPRQRANRWSEILNQPAEGTNDGWHIQLDRGTLRFTENKEANESGLSQIDLAVEDRRGALDRARQHGAAIDERSILVSGTTFCLIGD